MTRGCHGRAYQATSGLACTAEDDAVRVFARLRSSRKTVIGSYSFRKPPTPFLSCRDDSSPSPCTSSAELPFSRTCFVSAQISPAEQCVSRTCSIACTTRFILSGDKASRCGSLNLLEPLSKYFPDAFANYSETAARFSISAPIRRSTPSTPNPSFTILVPSRELMPIRK